MKKTTSLKKSQYTARCEFKFQPDEKKLCQEAAELFQVSLSEFVRTVAVKQARVIVMKNQEQNHTNQKAFLTS